MKKLISLLLILVVFSSCLAFGEGSVSASPADILKGMSTEQKVAQVLMPAFYYRQDAEGKKVGVQEIYPEMEEILRKYGFGGIIFNLQNAQENEKAVRLVDAVQTANASVPGRPLPFRWSVTIPRLMQLT